MDALHGCASCVLGVNTGVHIGSVCGVHGHVCAHSDVWQSCFRQGPPRFYRRDFGSSQSQALASVWLMNGTDFSRAPAAEAERPSGTFQAPVTTAKGK